MGDMYSQREQLLNAHGKVRPSRFAPFDLIEFNARTCMQVKETNSMAGEAGGILRGMAWRALYNTLCLYFVIIVLIAGNVAIAYYGLKKDDTPAPVPAPAPPPSP
jgi:hypothetical protein